MTEAVEVLPQQWREREKGEGRQVLDEQRSKEGGTAR